MREQLESIFAMNQFPEVDAGQATEISVADLREDIASGQSVAQYRLRGLVNGEWQELSRGTTIGYRKLDRFGPVTVSDVRLSIEEAIGEHAPISISLY